MVGTKQSDLKHEDVHDENIPVRPRSSTTGNNMEKMTKMIMQFYLIFLEWSDWKQNLYQNCWNSNKNLEAYSGFTQWSLQRFRTVQAFHSRRYDVETKASSRPKKAQLIRSIVMIMLTIFFEFNGIVHQKFLPQDYKIQEEYHLRVLRRLL